MQITTAAVLGFVAGALALAPSGHRELGQSTVNPALVPEPQGPCGRLMRKAVCCRKSLFGLVDIGCHRAKGDIHTGPDLKATCEANGKQPKCCIMGLAGIYGPCKPPHAHAHAGEFVYHDNGTDYDVEVIVTEAD